MIPAGSRYEAAERQFAPAHVYNQHGDAVFEDTTPPMLQFAVVNYEATYLVTTLPLPPPPPAEYYAKDSENFPFLGFKFLEDSRAWWRIAEVNPQIWYPLDIQPGTYMKIPS